MALLLPLAVPAAAAVSPALVDVQSTPTYICPTNPCVTLPVTISRAYMNPMLGFSVTIQLSGELALCSGTGSITEGTFLSSSGATAFEIIDNGGGSYTVDGVVIGNDCGPTATAGTLFSVGVTSSAMGGTGSISVTDVILRDCDNVPLPGIPGSTGTVPIDNQPPTVTVTSPNGGESWQIGTSQLITWTATDNTGVANVDLAYSTDGGASFPHVIATGVANTGSYAWTVPNTPTADARVQVVAHDVVCSSATDASDASFAIVDNPPTVHVTIPNGGEIASVGGDLDIQWTATDDSHVASVTIRLSRDNGATWEDIAVDIANTGSYTWAVTGPWANTSATPVYAALIRVEAKDDANQVGSDDSDAPFAIFGDWLLAVGNTPREFSLSAAWPNPSAGALNMILALPQTTSARVSVVDLQGREVAVLASGALPGGRYHLHWDGRTSRGDAAAGVYFVRYRSTDRNLERRFVLAR